MTVRLAELVSAKLSDGRRVQRARTSVTQEFFLATRSNGQGQGEECGEECKVNLAREQKRGPRGLRTQGAQPQEREDRACRP
jgi:hypothetical protein